MILMLLLWSGQRLRTVAVETFLYVCLVAVHFSCSRIIQKACNLGIMAHWNSSVRALMNVNCTLQKEYSIS